MGIYIGIDNGLNGGIVAINDSQEIIIKKVMPIIKGDKNDFDVHEIVKIFEELFDVYDGQVFVMLEKAHVRPVQGIRAAFTTGFCFGIFQGVLESFGLSYEVVNPTVWMKTVFEGHNSEDKKISIQWCQRKWPKEDWRATERSSKIHDGLTDAAAISYYSYLKNRVKYE